MIARLAVLALGLATALPATALPATALARSCHDAAADAERAYGIPTGLLDAIGHIESGRFDPATGRVDGWPYAYNVAGRGYFAADATSATAEVAALQLAGSASIDVGCFQINLFYHPEAFANLADGFDPDANATAAARFLVALHAQTGGWDSAVAMYHSAVPERGEPYRQMVLADWQGTPVASWRGVRISLTPPKEAAARPARDPYTILLSPAASLVAVFRPAQGAAVNASSQHAALNTSSHSIPAVVALRGLPVVYTPGSRG